MSAAGGPKITTDNMVMCLDAHDAKSYPGEPTTNYFEDLGEVTKTEFGQYRNLVPIFETYGLVPYTLSMDIKVSIPGWVYVYMQNGSYTKYSFVAQSVTCTKEYQRFSFTNLTPAGPTATWLANTPTDHRAMLATYTGYGTGTKPTVRNIQIEKGSYATPYVKRTGGRPTSVNLMIHGNVGSGQSFTDSSPSGHTITAVGNVSHSTTKSKFSGGSIYYDNSGDYLSIPASTDWVFSGDFTIDFWCYIDSTQSSNYSHFFTLTSQSVMSFKYQLSGNLLYLYTGGTDITCTIDLEDAWHHVALVRSGTGSNNLQIFVDGVLKVSASKNDTWGNSTGTAYIGWGWGTEWFKGYLDEMRVTQGTALWTSAFTPPKRRIGIGGSGGAAWINRATGTDGSAIRSGANFYGGAATKEAHYADGQVIEPKSSAIIDFDGTDDKASIVTDSVAIHCFQIAIRWNNISSKAAVGFTADGVHFNGLTIGPWTSTMDDETIAWWGYGTGAGSGAATYIKTVVSTDWHIITANWTGSTSTGYDIWIDGVKQTVYARGGGSGHSGLLDGVTAIHIGWNEGWNNYFDGQIGFLRYYDASLTDSEIKQNFNAHKGRYGI